jgi:hypothetical protein
LIDDPIDFGPLIRRGFPTQSFRIPLYMVFRPHPDIDHPHGGLLGKP